MYARKSRARGRERHPATTEEASRTDRAGQHGGRRRLLRAFVVGGLLGLLVAPVSVWATDGFSDVPDANTHHDAINAIRDAGVTAGCATGLYCPGDVVRRDQMASFLDRLGGLSGQDPVVNAATLQGLGPEDLGGSAGVTGIEIVTEETTADGTADTATVQADCPDDKVIVGGGGGTSTLVNWALSDSRPSNIADGTATSWRVWYIKFGGDTEMTLTAYAICADAN